MWYDLFGVSVLLGVFLFTSVTFINIGIKLGTKGCESLKMPSVKRKPKVSKEVQRNVDIMYNIENFQGRGSTERDIK